LVVTILNLASRTMGANFGVIMVAIKITALVFIAILGLLTLIRNGPGPAFSAETFFEGTSTEPSSYAIALYSGLWAFDGWDQCNVGLNVSAHFYGLDVDGPSS
jgi:amino acid transporter